MTSDANSHSAVNAETAPEPLHVFVNRRRFGEADGVRSRMTGAQIAALVDVPADNAVIRREHPPENPEVGTSQEIEVRNGDRFLVTRKVVEGGHESPTS